MSLSSSHSDVNLLPLKRKDTQKHKQSSICRRGLLRSVAPGLMSYKIACALRRYLLLCTLSVRLYSDLTLSPCVLCAMTVQDITATLKILHAFL